MKIIIDKNLLLDENEETIRFIQHTQYEFFCFDFLENEFLKKKLINCTFLKSNTLDHKLNINSSTKITNTDNFIIHAISKKEYDFYITNNEYILSISQNLGIADKILTPEDADNLFIKHDMNYSLNISFLTADKINVNDKIFDTLKNSYPEFVKWFKKIQEEKRGTFAYFNDDQSLGGIVIFKQECDNIKLQNEILTAKKRLKVSTFIVTANGYKIGELFIRIIIEQSIKLNINEIYLTHFVSVENTDSLVLLINQYGFDDNGKNERGEHIFIKKMLPDNKNINLDINDISDFDKKYYPTFYGGPKVNKFLIPIQPKYYTRLFLQPKNAQLTLLEFGYPLTERNTIKKAYISRANIKRINPGDVIIFYVSQDKKALTVLGIVETAVRLNTKEDIIKMIGERSVYSESEIKDGDQLVILFTYNCRIKDKFNLNYLISNGILQGAPQSIMELKNYNKVINNEGLDGCHTFN